MHRCLLVAAEQNQSKATKTVFMNYTSNFDDHQAFNGEHIQTNLRVQSLFYIRMHPIGSRSYVVSPKWSPKCSLKWLKWCSEWCRPNCRPNFWIIFAMNMTTLGIRIRSDKWSNRDQFWVSWGRFREHLGDTLNHLGDTVNTFWNMKVFISITLVCDSLYDDNYWNAPIPDYIPCQ